MKKLLLLPLFFVAAMTTSKAQAPVTSGMETKNGPVMTFEVLEYNFGTIKQGESATYEFKFKNTGREPLIINEAHGSCGCTVPDYPKEPIKPNGQGTIKVTFNSTGKMGVQDKTVTVTYDTDKTVILHMKGTVEAAQAPAGGAQAPAGGAAKPQPAPAAGAATKPAPAKTAPVSATPAVKTTSTAPAPASTTAPATKSTTPAPAATPASKPAPAVEKPRNN
jgi:hypothetical protein